MSDMPTIDPTDRPEADAEQRQQLVRIRAVVELASATCGGDRGDMLVTFIGASVLVARSTCDPDATLVEIIAAFENARKRIAERRAAEAPAGGVPS